MQHYKAVLFDLDDTLYPESQFRLSGYRAVAGYLHKVFGLDIRDEIQARHAAGEPGDLCAAVVQRHFQQPDPLLLQRLRAVLHYHKPEIALFPDVRLALAQLHANRIPTGLVTDYYSQVQRNKVKALDLELLLDAFLFSDDLGGAPFWRPSPEPFHVMAVQMECEPSEFIFVGDDAALDFVAPRRLGMGTIQVARGRAPAAAGPAERAAHVRISSLDMLWDAIQLLERSRAGAPEKPAVACK